MSPSLNGNRQTLARMEEQPWPAEWAGCVIIADRMVVCECGWEHTGELATLWAAFNDHREEMRH